jgi:class 3 adenylate cyclase
VGGEYLDAAVVFADISGFTALSEKLDPEEVTTVVNSCFEKLEAIVLAHGGIVDEYLGDCVKAVFGLTPGTTDAAAHAISAALEMRDAVYEYDRDAGLPCHLNIHIGVSSGPVVATVVGGAVKSDFTVLGDTVRLAAALEDASDKGQIFVGAETRRCTDGEFEYRPLPPLALPHARDPVPIYELLGPRPRRRIKRDSERRQATVLFADIVGLEGVSDPADSGGFTRVLNRCLADCSDAVAAHGGVLDKYTGDGIMALFGIPNAIENAPGRSLNAAIAIREAITRVNQESGFTMPLQVHVGVNTGLAIAGEIGGRLRRDFTAMGDTVNLAARLKEASAPGAIWVGPDTYRYTREAFEFRPLAPLTVTGKAQPIAAYELLSARTQWHRTSAAQPGRMVFSPLVGRARELEVITRRIAALGQREGGIVSLTGEAGLGKSRLVAEMFRLSEGRDVGVYLGRCLAVGRTQSFHPFIDLLHHLTGIADDAPEDTALATLERCVRGVLGSAAPDVFPFLTRLMGLHVSGAPAERLAGIEGDALERLIVKSMRELLQAIGRRQPTVLVFEDLHWADRSSLGLLESLLSLVTEVPLLFVLVCRPLFEDTSDRILSLCAQRYAARHDELRLDPLDDAEAAQLVRNLLSVGDLPAAVQRLITGKAEGNPFYVEEVVRSLIDAGAVEYRDGGFQVTEAIHSVVIPNTIHDVIMARVDRLDESARRLLQLASVIGRHFYYRILAHIVEAETPLDPDLSRLVEKQLIQERTGRWEVAVGERSVADEIEYLFKHALAQEAVYQSILLKTRKELHARVASAIEAIFTERLSEFYAPLAYHYRRAEQLARAEDYLCKAGTEAARAAASRDALHFFREAAALYDTLHGSGGDTRHRALLEKNIALALLNSGQLVESIAHFDTASMLLGDRVPEKRLGSYLRVALNFAALLAQLYLHLGRRRTVADWEHERELSEILFNRARAEITSDPTRLFLESVVALRRFHEIDVSQIDQACTIYASAAGMFCYSGLSFAIGRRILADAKALARQGNVRDQFSYRTMQFISHYLEGDWSDAYVLEAALVDEALRAGQFWDANTYLGLYCDRLLRQGRFAEARAQLAKLTEMNDAYGYRFAGTNHDGMLAILLLEERRLSDALRAVETYGRDRVEDPLRVLAYGTRAKIQELSGDLAGARTSLAVAETITVASSRIPPWHLSAYAAARLRCAIAALDAAPAHEGERRRLRHAARAALGVAAKVAVQRTEIFQLAGVASWLLGRRARALALWKRSIETGTRLGARPELARTYAAAAMRMAPATTLHGLDAAACRAKAEALFAEVGLAHDLGACHRAA